MSRPAALACLGLRRPHPLSLAPASRRRRPPHRFATDSRSRYELGRYGCVWRSQGSTTSPLPDEEVGLSIAGLHALRGQEPEAGQLADTLAQAIGVLAGFERELQPDFTKEVSLELPLKDYTLKWLEAGMGNPRALTPRAFLDTLQKEYAPVSLRETPNGFGSVTLRMFLAPFFGVTSATEYLDLVGAASVMRQAPESVSGLAIAQSLDHLSLVLSAHPDWPSGSLVNAPDLRAAATIALTVTNVVEFRDRLSAMAAIFEALRVPKLSETELRSSPGASAQQPKPLLRLDLWLRPRLPQSASLAVSDAVSDLRDVVRVRAEGQHTGSGLRKEASKARVRLGLPEPIYDWAEAWNLVKGRIVSALDSVSSEIRFAELESGQDS